MAQGVEVIDYLASLPGMEERPAGGALDVLIVGAGAAGLNAALRAQEKGLRYVLLEKEKIANTIVSIPQYEKKRQTPEVKRWLSRITQKIASPRTAISTTTPKPVISDAMKGKPMINTAMPTPAPMMTAFWVSESTSHASCRC